MPSLKTLLDPLIKLLKENEKSYSLDRITQSMGQHTHALILLFFSLPFAFPLTIPGLSVPFGIVLFFLGLRFTLNKSFWLPRFIRKKSISLSHLHLSIKILDNFLKKTRKILKPRIPSLFKTPVITGTVICIQSFFQSIPIPLPFTNVFAAIPLVLLGLGLLRSDGLFILLGYLTSLISITFFILLFWFGIEGLERISPF